jgi:3'-5' exonuclease
MNTPQLLFLDLETIPAGEKEPIDYPPIPNINDVKTGNRKGDTAILYAQEKLPDLIEAHKNKCAELDLKNDEKYRKRAVHSLECEIICMGYAFDDDTPKVIFGTDYEIVKGLDSLLSQFGDQRHAITFVGHNIKEFDLKLFYHRAIKYKLRDLLFHLQMLSKENVFDTMDEWAFFSYREFTSMDDILTFLGMEGKGDIDGSKVFDLYLAGEFKKIYHYCMDDVKKVRKLHKAFTI